MADAGYRAPPPGTACSRGGGFVDASRAVLSSEGLPVCARYDAQLQIAASAPRPTPTLRIPWRLPWRIPWNDAFVSLGVGAALLVGAPVSPVGAGMASAVAAPSRSWSVSPWYSFSRSLRTWRTSC